MARAAFLPAAQAAAAQRQARRQRLSVAVAASSGGFGSKKAGSGSGNKKVGQCSWSCAGVAEQRTTECFLPLAVPLQHGARDHASLPACRICQPLPNCIPNFSQQPKLARYLETDGPATAAASLADDGWVRGRAGCYSGGQGWVIQGDMLPPARRLALPTAACLVWCSHWRPCNPWLALFLIAPGGDAGRGSCQHVCVKADKAHHPPHRSCRVPVQGGGRIPAVPPAGSIEGRTLQRLLAESWGSMCTQRSPLPAAACVPSVS